MSTDSPEVADVDWLVNEHLAQKWAQESAEHVPSGMKWRASGLGHCLREQYIERHLKQPHKREIDNQGRKVREVGKKWHRDFREWFEEMGLLLEVERNFDDPELNISARADFIIGGEFKGRTVPKTGIELKSRNSKSYQYRSRYQNETATYEQMMQAATYEILAEKAGADYGSMGWILATVSKDDLRITQDVVRQAHKEEALRRIGVLNDAAETGNPPPCSCLEKDERGEGGWWWRFCGQYAGSESSRKIPAPIPTGEFYKSGKLRGQPKTKPAFVPDGPCCQDVTDYV